MNSAFFPSQKIHFYVSKNYKKNTQNPRTFYNSIMNPFLKRVINPRSSAPSNVPLSASHFCSPINELLAIQPRITRATEAKASGSSSSDSAFDADAAAGAAVAAAGTLLCI